MFNRRRIDIRKYLKLKYFFILSVSIFVVTVSLICISGMILANKIKNSTIVYSKNDVEYEINEENEVVEVFKEDSNTTSESVEENIDEDNQNVINNEIVNKTNNIKPNKLNFCLLGEIMMGGDVGKNINYSYASSFKNVYTITRSYDFTYANFSTNITNLETIEHPKSSYIVTKDIINALLALGLDSVSIASDHIIDFSPDVLKNTINTLESNNIFVAGRENTPVYFQKDDKRIAIVSTNTIINGTSTLYKKQGISIYDSDNLVKNIKEAKENSDVVIVDIHWGREFVYGVTDQMQQIAKLAADSGADLVIGSHAAGVYPIITYNDVPIIYSLGYFIGDSDLYVGKESFIFDITVSKENKIEEINMTPIYIRNKVEVLMYNEYDNVKCNSILNQYNTWHIENGLDSSIENGAIRIKF